MTSYDVIVLGLGAMGASATYQLAKRGARVLGIDQYAPPHAKGSSHGETRITRLANGESAHYTAFVRRSHEIWRELERETGQTLLTQCGGLFIHGGSDAQVHVADFFDKTVRNAKKNGVPHELLDAAEIRRRFAVFDAQAPQQGYFEPDAGFVRPETCIATQLRLAQVHGAQVHGGERVLSFEAGPRDVRVSTDRGNYCAGKVIVSLGAWLRDFPGIALKPRLRVLRQVLYWFPLEGSTADYEPRRFPVFIWALPNSQTGIYGFPVVDPDRGLKIATEQWTDDGETSTMHAEATDAEIEAMRGIFATVFPQARAGAPATAVCAYTETPDREFIIDFLPGSHRVVLVSACSGHGFKHSPAIGEAVAELALLGRTRHDLSPFGLSRFG